MDVDVDVDLESMRHGWPAMEAGQDLDDLCAMFRWIFVVRIGWRIRYMNILSLYPVIILRFSNTV
jgi:hypothetical protein